MSPSDGHARHPNATTALNADVWGGSLLSLEFDPVTHTCTLTTEMHDGPEVGRHILSCRGVTELRFDNAIPEPWSYAEITEVHAHYNPLRRMWLLELMLWSEDSGLTVRCSELSIDGEVQAPAPG